MLRSSRLWQSPDADFPPPDSQRLLRRDAKVGVEIHLTFAEAVNLQSNEPRRMRLVHGLVDEILHQVAVDPSLNARSTGDNTQSVPAFVDEVVMSLIDLLLRGQPVGS